jgi:hypothetical protein
MTVSPIGSIKVAEIHPSDRVDHKPRQMTGRQPLPHIRRQQKPLLTTTLDEILRHAGISLARPDGTTLRDSLSPIPQSQSMVWDPLTLAVLRWKRQ